MNIKWLSWFWGMWLTHTYLPRMAGSLLVYFPLPFNKNVYFFDTQVKLFSLFYVCIDYRLYKINITINSFLRFLFTVKQYRGMLYLILILLTYREINSTMFILRREGNISIYFIRREKVNLIRIWMHPSEW